MKQKRLAPTVRKDAILAAACALAEKGKTYDQLTRDEIGSALGITGTAVQYHFSTVKKMRRAIMRYAVQHGRLTVILQGMVQKDPQALSAPQKLRERAAQAIT